VRDRRANGGGTVSEMLALADANMVAMYCHDARATRGGFVVERPGIVLCGAPTNLAVANMAIVRGCLDAPTVEAETARVFGESALPFTVWTRAHAEAGLDTDLQERGWTLLMRVPAMVLDAGAGELFAPPAGVAIRPVADVRDCRAYAAVAAEAWTTYGVPPASTAAHFHDPRHLLGPETAAFLAWEGRTAVAGAVLYLLHGVAGIGWVSTVTRARGRGLGAAVTSAAVREGRRRGARWTSLQASVLGAPVYRRMGFCTLSSYGVFVQRG